MTAVFTAALTACALAPRSAPVDGSALTGRLSLRVDDAASASAAVAATDRASATTRNLAGSFELSGDAQQGLFELNTPLGTTLARATWQPGQVTLSTPQGTTNHADLASLTRDMLGEELPVAAMFDWLRGRPWPGAASTPVAVSGSSSAPTSAAATSPTDPSFSQLGWNVDLTQFADAWVTARRVQPPAVTVRIKLDRP